MPARSVVPRYTRRAALFLAVLGLLSFAGALRSPVHRLSAAEAGAAYGRLPLSFEPNVGQADAAVQFLAHGPGYTLSLTADGATLTARDGSALQLALAAAAAT